MNEYVRRIKSFLFFEFPLQPGYISARFRETQYLGENEFTGWGTTATRQKMIYEYWFTIVVRHFLALIIIPAIFILISGDQGQFPVLLLGILSAGLICFTIIYLFHYRPYFDSIFLPRLETIKESYDRKESGKLEKCRKSQLSNFALTLVFYAIDKTCNMNTLQCNDQSANRIARLYGVDPGSLKNNLRLIFGKGKALSSRKYTEIRNQFEEAYMFLEEINFTQGIAHLRRLEQKVLLET